MAVPITGHLIGIVEMQLCPAYFQCYCTQHSQSRKTGISLESVI
jgi:hypothetical protein